CSGLRSGFPAAAADDAAPDAREVIPGRLGPTDQLCRCGLCLHRQLPFYGTVRSVRLSPRAKPYALRSAAAAAVLPQVPPTEYTHIDLMVLAVIVPQQTYCRNARKGQHKR